MFENQFYNQTIRRYIVAFGNMFNDLVVQRLNSAGTVIQTIAVPIAYGPKEKWLVRIKQDANLDQSVALQLPRMGFEMTGLAYDGTRRLSATTKNVSFNSPDLKKMKYQYVPVPYNIDMTLSIFVKNADDGAQIIEQIIPYFGPEWNNTINLIPEMGIKMDVPTILVGVAIDDTYEGDFIARRALVYTITFTVKGWFFGPVKRAGVIKRAQVDLGVVYAANTAIDPLLGAEQPGISDEDVKRTGRSSRIVLTPGQFANGSPTSNSALSVNYLTISANSDYGICANVFSYSDGLKYNPVTGIDEVRSFQFSNGTYGYIG